MSRKHFNFKSSIRDWYIRAFPSDELGYRINPLATFAGAVKCMADGGDIYKYLGVGASLVRENVFSKSAAITGVDYDAVYDLCLASFGGCFDLHAQSPPVSGGLCFPMGFANGGRLFGSQGRRL